jgi:serine protease AprX
MATRKTGRSSQGGQEKDSAEKRGAQKGRSEMGGQEMGRSAAGGQDMGRPPGMGTAGGQDMGRPPGMGAAGGQDMGRPPGMGAAGGQEMGGQEMGRPPVGEMGGPPGMGAAGGREEYLVEIRMPKGRGTAYAAQMAAGLEVPGLQVDPSYRPVPIAPPPEHAEALEANNEEVVVVLATIEAERLAELRAHPQVVGVYKNTRVEPFQTVVEEEVSFVSPREALGTCAIPPCDCAPGVAKGTIADVAHYLGADQIWGTGQQGAGIVVGIVDGGITALGRTPKPGETAKIPRVIGGYPSDWGTTAAAWGDHGNMTSTDALGMAPQAQLYDIRISAGALPATLAAALQGYQWAITQHQTDGTPHVLSNSWGIFQESWDPDYATDPNHPFTRKVVEALDEGILVLFAAGNCGEACPDGRCGTTDIGPGRSIWAVNGHPRVMTVAAVNMNEEYVGYSSEGPAALNPHKPDFASVTHFQGYFASDSGTSAATPIAAGVTALLKGGKPSLTQDEAKAALMGTAKDIGPPGWDPYVGAGIIRAKAAYDVIARPAVWSGWENQGGYCLDGPAAASWAANRLDVFVLGGDQAMYHKWWDGSSWSGWENLGGYCLGGPGAVSWGPNRIDTFVIGSDHAMYHKWWDGSSWSGWENLGGYCLDGPAAASWAANRLDVFVLGSDQAMYHKWWDGSSWSGWENLGGYCLGGPGAVSWGPNRIDTFVLGGDHAMYHKWWG